MTHDELKYLCRSYGIKYTSAEKKEELFYQLSNYMSLGLEATTHNFSSILEPSIDPPQKERSEKPGLQNVYIQRIVSFLSSPDNESTTIENMVTLIQKLRICIKIL